MREDANSAEERSRISWLLQWLVEGLLTKRLAVIVVAFCFSSAADMVVIEMESIHTADDEKYPDPEPLPDPPARYLRQGVAVVVGP